MTEEESTPEKKEEKADAPAEPEIKTETPIVQPEQSIPEQPPVIAEQPPEHNIPEQPPMTPEEFVNKEEPLPEQPEQPVEPPCDPATMTCDEIKDKITVELIPESYKHKTAVEKIEEIKKIDPSPEIDKALSAATEKMEKTNKEIADMFEKYKYAICEKPTEEKKPEEEQTEGP